MCIVLEHLKDVTGIYRLGFERESFLGLVLPILFVIIVGGGIGFFVSR